MEQVRQKNSLRQRADKVKAYKCKNLIAVIENPADIVNVGTVIRNVDALGVEKTYVIDPANNLPDDWQEMRVNGKLSKTSVSAIKWSFVKKFQTTQACVEHLEKKGFVSIVTSPHMKGRTNVVLEEGDYTGFKKLAVWFGSETRGISDFALEKSALCVNIPMSGIIESLNLGTSSGIVLYEIARQRRAFQNLLRVRVSAKRQKST